MRRNITMTFAACFFITQMSFGQEESSVDTSTIKEVKLTDYYIDLAIPDNGISNLIQVDFSQVKNLNNLKDFAIQVFDGGDNAESKGIGAEFSLGHLFVKRDNRTLENYRYGKNGYRLLRNLRPLVGFTNSDKGTNLAVGLNFNLINKADYYLNGAASQLIRSKLDGATESEFRLSYSNEATIINRSLGSISGAEDWEFSDNYSLAAENEVSEEVHKTIIEGIQNSELSTQDKQKLILLIDKFRDNLNEYLGNKKETDSQLGKSLDEIKQLYNQQNWNAKFLTANGGILWNSTDQKIKNLKAKKWQFAMAYGTPIKDKSQLLFTVRYSGNIEGRSLMETDGTQTDEEQNTLFYGARFLTKLNKKKAPMTANIFIEAGNTRTTFFNRDFKEELRGVLGIEAKIFEGTWIQTGVAFQGGGATFQIDFKHAFVEKSRF